MLVVFVLHNMFCFHCASGAPYGIPQLVGCVPTKLDTLALATGTRVGASDHAIARFCINYGRVLGFVLRYFIFCGLNVHIIVCYYICGCDALCNFVTQFSCVVPVSVPTSRKRSCGVPGKPPQQSFSSLHNT